jgi:TRAP-type C4-dicarboxylate transport system permease small subunit
MRSAAEPGALARIDAAILMATRGLAALGAGCIVAMAGLTVAAVVMRYGAGAPFRFTEELGGLLLVTSVFLSLPYVLARHGHIRLTLLADRMPGPLRRALWILGQLVFVAFAVIFLRDAWADALFTRRLNLRSEAARIPLTGFVFIPVVGIALAGSIALWQALRPRPEG